MPTGNVVDLSHHNTVTAADFAGMKTAGILGVIHKATQGVGYTDSKFHERKAMATDAGLMFGGYHFGTNEDATAQRDHFLSVVDPSPETLLALDHEENQAHTMNLETARTFLTGIRDAVHRPAWYYSGSLIKGLLGKKVDPFFASHLLWLAQYGPHAVSPASWAKPTLWQFTDRGTIAGVEGHFDLNQFDGGAAELAKVWALEGDPVAAAAAAAPDRTQIVGTVEWIQAALHSLGATITVDGQYGPKTSAAVAEFHKSEGMSVAPGTRSSINDTVARLELRLAELAKTGQPG